MKILSFIFLVLLSIPVFGGGTSEKVNLISLTETGNNKYTFKYKSMNSGKIYTIYLSYSKLGYLFKARFLTKDKYEAAIAMLAQQLNQNTPVRFGWFGGGPCPVDKDKNIYRSDALEIYNEGYPNNGPHVVYTFCEYS